MTKLDYTKNHKNKLVSQRGYEAEPGIASENRQGWVNVVTGRDEDQRGKKPKKKQ
jgi:hypothetical protein